MLKSPFTFTMLIINDILFTNDLQTQPFTNSGCKLTGSVL